MSNSFNKSYRIRTEVGKDTQVHINLNRDYDVLELMSLKIDQKNFYKFHTSNYGVIAGRVLANDVFGIPNAKVSVFIPIDSNDQMDVVKSVLYPYNSTQSQNKDGVRYNLLPNEQLNDCHTIIGTFPEKQYLLDNDNILEVFEKYYKFTTRTNNAGDYMIFGVPTGSQTLHVDIDLSDIGILSQKPRDMFYKGYNIEAFENPNKFKYDTNLDSLVQVISQDNIADVIPFWGEDDDTSIGITRCDIHVQYKFEPTCVFMGSVVSDTNSNGISKKCIPTPGMGSMEEITTGSGTIEMIRKTPNGNVEEFQIKGNQLINGNGVWCYQIPMNLDYMMTDEFGNMVPTNRSDKGIPTRTRVRFRISLQDFDNDNENLARGKILVPHNPDIHNSYPVPDYNFGTKTQEESYRDLFWNGVYSVKSYIPRIQKGTNWKNEKFTGFKRVNYYGQNNPIPYNNIRIKIPFAFTMMCVLIKSMIRMAGFLNWIFRMTSRSFTGVMDDEGDNTLKSGSFISISGELCNDNLDFLCIIPGVPIKNTATSNKPRRKTLLGTTLMKHAEELGFDLKKLEGNVDESANYQDSQSIDKANKENSLDKANHTTKLTLPEDKNIKGDATWTVNITGIRVTDKLDYFIQCIEMKLAQEFKVIQFDFYNDWINGLIYIPRWMRIITKKRTFLWGAIKIGGKVKACNETTSRRINLVQQCALSYIEKDDEHMYVTNNIGCKNNSDKLYCHKSSDVRQKFRIFKSKGLVHSFKNMNDQYIYYFKPIDDADKYVRLFATDIILLGTLNNCDIWGIPNDLTQLTSSTYQMPPNLALTDSDLEGNDYETDLSATKTIQIPIDPKQMLVKKKEPIALNGCNVGINPFEEDGNYTEISGIDWGYEGPLQAATNPTKLYKPGGHFLGITCRNAETSIKSCVNLSRICEYGVRMSQRQELNVPTTATKKEDIENIPFYEYATVPSGFITKDEISDTNYRRLFASLNKNKLRTTINPATGYPVYDFEYVNPTNFGGELNKKFMGTGADADNMNRRVAIEVKEHYYEYTDDDYYHRTDNVEEESVKETQIMRTGEFPDSEYLKYRFGLNDEDFNDKGIIKKKARQTIFLNYGTPVIINNKPYRTLSFPLYENSFYFYFGLKDGNTALDEFKKTYYANCNKVNLTSNVSDINLRNLKVTYDGFENKENSGSGSINFDIVTSGDNVGWLNCTLIDSNDNKCLGQGLGENLNNIEVTNLKADRYKLLLSNNDNTIRKEFPINVDRISFAINVKAVPFNVDVSEWGKDDHKDNYSERAKIGGYLIIPNNTIQYKKGDNNTIDLNIFESPVISGYQINYASGGMVSYGTGTKFYLSNNKHVSLITDSDGNYMIPVLYGDIEYQIKVSGYINKNDYKPIENDNKSDLIDEFIASSSVYVANGKTFDFTYNGVSFVNELSPILENDENSDTESKEGWWSIIANEDTGRLVWDVESSDLARWNIKNALYMSNIYDETNPHIITINAHGGKVPYTSTLEGEDNDMSTTFRVDNNLSALQTITVPTINYNKNGKRRSNFSYCVTDSYGLNLPKNKKPFIIPVIYKPFFMEMLLCCYGESDNSVYLCGNVYNGKTWTEEEGFNNVLFNGEKLAAITNLRALDTDLKLDEIDISGQIHNGGGLSYTGSLQKYNGRKITINRLIKNFDILGIATDGSRTPCEVTIGTTHNEGAMVYTDSTTVKNDNISLCTFVLETDTTSEVPTFNMSVKSNSDVEYRIYPIIDSPATTEIDGVITVNKGCYPYPLKNDNGQPDIANTLLFRHIMEGVIESVFDYDESDLPIAIAVDDDRLNEKNVYYIAIPVFDETIVNEKTTNTNSILKSVSISKLIDVKTIGNNE